MASNRLITAVLFLTLLLAQLPAKPNAPRRGLPPSDVSQTTQANPLQVDVTNANHSVHSILTNRIGCFQPHPGRPLVTLEGCKASLNKFKTFPLYRLKQDFQENVYPRKPQPPPFAVHDRTCTVEVRAVSPHIVDKFSFEQIRVLALEIIQECLDRGGVGGIASIGRGIGWVVSVKGIKNVNGTAIGETEEEEDGGAALNHITA